MATTDPQPQQEPKCTEVSPSLTAVTVFRDRAQLTYVATASLPVGAHVISMKGEKGWESVLQNTLQVHMEGAENQQVVMRGVRFRTHVTKEDVRERVRELEKARDKVRELIDQIADKKAANDAVEAALKKMEEKLLIMGECGVGPEVRASMGPMVGFLSKPESWSELVRFITRRKLALGELRLKLSRQQDKHEEEENEIIKKLDELTGGRHKERQETSVEVMISVYAPHVNLKLAVSFVAMGVSWTPLYDIRVDPERSVMDVTYHAQVCQGTAMDWNKVLMKLSTATPHFSAAPPELKEWNISLDPPKFPVGFSRFLSRSLPSNNRRERGNEEAFPRPQAAIVEQAVVSSSSTSSTFQIVGLATVRSDNKPVKVTIATHTFPVKLVYHAVPKLSPWTYLIVKANNTSPYVFLSGKANVFANNTFVSSSQLELVPVGAELTMSIGTDDAVKVTRKQVKRTKSTLHAMLRNRKKVIEYVYEFTVKSSLTAEATLVVKDQCPVSSHKDITVRLIEPSKNMLTECTKVDDNDCSVDNGGIVEWRLQLPSGVFTRDFRFAFQVEHNENMDVSGLDVED
ncbi:Aspartate ammonia-lyase [Trypanosoma cruzi]|nr:Aspartate ammonia-lyase [Trypanosoma cruzi]